MILIQLSIDREGPAEYLFQIDETEPTIGWVCDMPISIETVDGSAIVEIRVGDQVSLNLDGLTIEADVRDIELLQ